MAFVEWFVRQVVVTPLLIWDYLHAAPPTIRTVIEVFQMINNHLEELYALEDDLLKKNEAFIASFAETARGVRQLTNNPF